MVCILALLVKWRRGLQQIYDEFEVVSWEAKVKKEISEQKEIKHIVLQEGIYSVQRQGINYWNRNRSFFSLLEEHCFFVVTTLEATRQCSLFNNTNTHRMRNGECVATKSNCNDGVHF